MNFLLRCSVLMHIINYILFWCVNETITVVLEITDNSQSELICGYKLQTMFYVFFVEMHIINDILFSVRCNQTSLSERARQKDDLEDLTKHWQTCLNGREPLFPLIQGEGLKVMKITSLSTPYPWNASSMCSHSSVRWTSATLPLCVQAGVA